MTQAHMDLVRGRCAVLIWLRRLPGRRNPELGREPGWGELVELLWMSQGRSWAVEVLEDRRGV